MRISELMEYLEPEDNKTVDKENMISPEKVEQLVMKKIQEEQSLKRELMRTYLRNMSSQRRYMEPLCGRRRDAIRR